MIDRYVSPKQWELAGMEEGQRSSSNPILLHQPETLPSSPTPHPCSAPGKAIGITLPFLGGEGARRRTSALANHEVETNSMRHTLPRESLSPH
jgi:hypothetical protein